jgi:ElaB/YqjD/DUF883 family membrane-anchored ribosome-binding protein
MMKDSWSERLNKRRTAIADRAGALSAGAKEAAEGASERIGAVYGQVRGRVGDVVSPARDKAGKLLEAGTDQAERFAKEGRTQFDRATFASRGLIAERPLTAVGLGIAAGLVLGLLTNHLGKSRIAEEADENGDDWLE